MHICCYGSVDGLLGRGQHSEPEASHADGSAVPDEAPTTSTVANQGAVWAVGSGLAGEPIVVVSLQSSTNYAWAARRAAAMATPGAPGCSRAAFSHRNWACSRSRMRAPGGVPPPRHIVFYDNPLADWAASAVRRWLVRSNVAAASGPGGVFVARELAAPPLEPVVRDAAAPAASGQEQQQTAPPGQQQQQSPRPARTPQLLPYSVPTLAVGDVFLSCNTVAGLENADDWDFGSLGSSRPLAGGTASTSSTPAPGQHAPPAHSHTPPRPRSSPLDLASELLLRMSVPVGGQRLMFVSKESAELVRRALLLSRYDEIMERRAAEAEDAEAEAEAAEAVPPGSGGAPSTRLVVSTSAAAGSRVPRVAGAAVGPGTGTAPGWGSAGRSPQGGPSTSGSDGAEEDRPKPPFAPWPRRQSSTDRAPTAGASPTTPPASPESAAHPNTTASSAGLADVPGGVTLSSGSGSGSGGGGGGGDGSAPDGMPPDMPGWIPGPVRETVLAAARGFGGWLAHAGGGAAAAASSVPQGVAVLFRRGATGGGGGGSGGGVLEVSPGPRPRLPAPPLTGLIRLPPLTTPTGGVADDPQRRNGDAPSPQEEEDAGAMAQSRGAQAAAGPADTGIQPVLDWALRDREGFMRELKQLGALATALVGLTGGFGQLRGSAASPHVPVSGANMALRSPMTQRVFGF
ncbi:hypothetical protein PLESTM_000463500 [Pleodorina starrii]|nr:hypothetical protein PLESTM_000463500 [Pleodorina starrii]